MSGLDRRRFLKLTGGIGVGTLTGLAGCSSSGEPQGTTTQTTTGDIQLEPTGDSIAVGMVYALGGLGDNSFNDMANRGVKQAETELGISYQNAEPSNPGDFSTFQRKFATSTSPDYDLISTIGFAQTSALSKTAPNFPKQRFMLVDSVLSEPNVASYVFREQEGSFQVGMLAGLLTSQSFSAGAGETNPDQKVVGFVGGKETPLIKKFEAGYKAGVKHVDSAVTVRTAYAGSWSDPGKGQSVATSMYGEGADIVYHAAGGTGVGVFRAAQNVGRYGIGVDAPQSESLPKFADVILASMVKRVDTAVFRSIKNVVEGSFRGGDIIALGLEEEGVSINYGAELGDDIPQSIKDRIATATEQIIAGDITVPEKPENV
ncbi:MAG: BMP family protein [Halodesulfurarchaeum sp.]